MEKRKIVRDLVYDVMPIIKADNLVTEYELDELYGLFYLAGLEQDERVEILEKLISNEKLDFNSLDISRYKKKERKYIVFELLKFKEYQEYLPVNIILEIDKLIKSQKIKKGVLEAFSKIVGLGRKLGGVIKWQNEIGGGIKIIDDPTEAVEYLISMGVPTVVLYAAGITGFSASGITSGLAAIGGGVALGLSPMAWGSIILVAIGMVTKKVSNKKITPFLKKVFPKIFDKKSIVIKEQFELYSSLSKMIMQDKKSFKISKFKTLFSKKADKRLELYNNLNKLYNLYTGVSTELSKKIEKH